MPSYLYECPWKAFEGFQNLNMDEVLMAIHVFSRHIPTPSQTLSSWKNPFSKWKSSPYYLKLCMTQVSLFTADYESWTHWKIQLELWGHIYRGSLTTLRGILFVGEGKLTESEKEANSQQIPLMSYRDCPKETQSFLPWTALVQLTQSFAVCAKVGLMFQAIKICRLAFSSY